MKDLFTKYYFSGIFKEINSESDLHQIGRLLGQKLALLDSFKREKDLDSLVYRIVFTVLPGLYCTTRTIDKGLEEYLITEEKPVIVSVDNTENGFCPSALIAGVIEVILNISGFDLAVTAYNGDRVRYLIRASD